jgi:hypothetical protein
MEATQGIRPDAYRPGMQYGDGTEIFTGYCDQLNAKVAALI